MLQKRLLKDLHNRRLDLCNGASQDWKEQEVQVCYGIADFTNADKAKPILMKAGNLADLEGLATAIQVHPDMKLTVLKEKNLLFEDSADLFDWQDARLPVIIQGRLVSRLLHRYSMNDGCPSLKGPIE